MTLRPDYSAHENMVADLRSKPELWRFALGLVIIAGVAMVLNILFFGILEIRAPDLAADLSSDMPGNAPAPLLVLLFSYGFATLAVVSAALLVHYRGLGVIMGGWHRCWRQFRRAMRGLAVLYAVMLLASFLGGDDLELARNLNVGLWITLLPLALAATMIQVSAEEILFRGYMQQALAARFSSPVIWMGLPSLLFALGHYMPATAGENAVIIALWSGLFGLAAADLTARTGTLGPAIALHFGNNALAFLFVSMPDMLSGLSLFVTPFGFADAEALRPWLFVDLFSILCCWLTIRLSLRV